MSAGGMALAPPGRRRAFRVRSPTAPPHAPERGAQAADTRPDENRSPGGLSGVPKRPSHPRRRRIRDRAGEARYSSADPAFGRKFGPPGCDIAAYPTNRPAGPCRPASFGRVRLRHPVFAARERPHACPCSRPCAICQSRVRHGVARFGDNVGACPAERPAGPCRQKHSFHPQIITKCLILFHSVPFSGRPSSFSPSCVTLQLGTVPSWTPGAGPCR